MTMAKIPHELHEHINAALFPNTPMLGTVDADGYPRVSLRGSTCVYDGETIAFWERSSGGVKQSIRDGAKICVFFQKPELRDSLLPIAGVARFFGTAKVHRDGPVREQVWNMILPAERDKDKEKQGFAVLVRVERAEDLRGQPLVVPPRKP
jgi:general stress protein 26